MLKRAGEFYNGLLKRHADNKAAHYHHLLTSMPSGQYISDLPYYGPANFNTVAGTLYAGIFVVHSDITIDRLGINITGAAGQGMQARLGIYACGAGMYPGLLILDAGVLEASSTGNRWVGIEKNLERGYYFLSLIAEESFTCSYLKVSQSPLGLYPTLAACYTGYSVSPGWGELPAVFPAGGNPSNVVRLVGARLK